MKLNANHWMFREYRERMTTKQWKQILLNNEDTIIYKGYLYKLKMKNLGCGVVEVFKDIPEK